MLSTRTLGFAEIIRSRTVWTIVALVLIDGLPAVRDLIPVAWSPYLDAFLGFLAIYFRATPKQG